jgi:FkbH-like protein
MNPPFQNPIFSTWLDVLLERASRDSGRIAYTFLPDGQSPCDTLTYGQLDAHARGIAARLQFLGAAGERALLLYPPGLEYIVAFVACLYAGVVAVPAYPPRGSRIKHSLSRLQSIFEDAKPKFILTLSSLAQHGTAAFVTGDSAEPQWLATDQMHEQEAANWKMPSITPDTLAFLQYTSGSTTIPKGVKVAHRNLLHNEWLISRAFEHTNESVVVGWLPLYHDMGLIGNVLQPLYRGIPCILMPPTAFLLNPFCWLSAISNYRATTSGAPDFAYDLCVQKIPPEKRAALDLSSWKVAFNGAEPIRPETLERFTAAFSSCGFRRETFYPCYGLAEATLMVSGGKPSQPPAMRSFLSRSLEQGNAKEATPSPDTPTRTLVGCGQNLPGQKIAIVDPESLRECPPRKIGEIWLSGESVAEGYWRREEQTETVFRAHLAECDKRSYLRTGDLGFFSDDELFVTGRLKDLIIIRGRNHYPQDIEYTMEKAHPALSRGCGAAFSVEINGNERLAVVQELDRRHRKTDPSAIVDAIREAIAAEHEINVYAVALLSPGGIPKTSSGKIQRHACHSGFLHKTLPLVHCNITGENPDASEPTVRRIEKILAAFGKEQESLLLDDLLCQTARILKLEPGRIDPQKSLVLYGLDSLRAIELAGDIEKNFGVLLSMAQIFETANLADLTAMVAGQIAGRRKDQDHQRQSAARATGNPLLSQADAFPGVRRVPASSAQQSLWLLHHRSHAGSLAYNIVVPVRFKGRLQPDALARSLNEIVRRHESLRTVYAMAEGQLWQHIAPVLHLNLPVESLIGIPADQLESQLPCRIAAQAQLPFDLASGPMIRLILYELTAEDHLLTITLHHIACDGWSIEVLLQECAALYRTFSSNLPPALPPVELQYSDCFPHPEKDRQSQLQYWRQQLDRASLQTALPADRSQNGSRKFLGAQEPVSIPAPVHEQLNALCRSEEMTPFMVLLTAFKALLCRLSGQLDLTIGSSLAHRDGVGRRGVIGPFTNAVALRTRLKADMDFRHMLQLVRRTALSAYANHDLPLGEALKDLKLHATGAAPFNVVFLFQNYLTTRWEMNGVIAELEPFDSGMTNFDLTLVFYEKSSQLSGSLVYRTDLFDRETARELANAYVYLLTRAVAVPDAKLVDFEIARDLQRKAEAASIRDQQLSIAISATFTAEPIGTSLDFWMQKLYIPAKIEFAPYNQIFQQLLDPQSILSRNKYGANVLLLRFADWNPEARDEREMVRAAEEHSHELIESLIHATARSTVPWLVCLCPSGPEDQSAIKESRAQFTRQLEQLKGVYLLELSELYRIYPVSPVFDPDTEALGHIPFSPQFFTALGTLLARKIHALRTPPYKVIAVDCDQTLWSGVCGEDGALGVKLDPPHQMLQEFLLNQGNAGMLLCLCTRNNPADVLDVFAKRPDFPLRLERFASIKINWQPKSENLKALSAELGLALDSFIFLDDNPIECAEVAANCPAILTLQLPPQAAALRNFLNHVWAFDRLKTTEEDQHRTALYQQNMEREHFRRETTNLEEFLAGLNLQYEIREITADETGRAAQLTQRTNQFNTTTTRYSETEMVSLCRSNEQYCFIVKARDRFGDYGLVGLMVAKPRSDGLETDLFLLSCRALGRRIEHQMLAFLGETALRLGRNNVTVRFISSSKNAPAFDFFHELVGQPRESKHGYCFQFDANTAADARKIKSVSPIPPPSPIQAVGPQQSSALWRTHSKVLAEIANELNALEQIHRTIGHQRRSRSSFAGKYVAPATPTETMLAEIWSEVLRSESLSLYDNFFELGGDSLLATIIVSRIRKVFDLELPLQTILEHPHISELAAVIERELIGGMDSAEVDATLRELNGLTDDEVGALLSGESIPRIQKHEAAPESEGNNALQ